MHQKSCLQKAVQRRSITLLLSCLLVIGFTFTTMTKCFALQGKEWKNDPTILFADARVLVVTTDMETGKYQVAVDKPVEMTTCVQIDDGDCVESRFFQATITDVKEGD